MSQLYKTAGDFKSALRSYRWMKITRHHLMEEIEEKENDLTGLGHHQRELTEKQLKSPYPMPHYQGGSGRSLVDRIVELDEIKAKLAGIDAVVTSVEAVLDRMDFIDRNMVVDYYCDHIKANIIAIKYEFYDGSGVRKRIERAIKEAFK